MPRTPFLLSHHPPSQYDRCLSLGPWKVCARCLGVYPLLVALLALQISLRLPISLPGDWLVVLLFPLPAFVDWARGRFDPRSGSNLVRFVSGAFLAVALARALYLHMRQPLHPLAAIQFGALAIGAAVVEFAVRRRRIDPAEGSHVHSPDDADPRD